MRCSPRYRRHRALVIALANRHPQSWADASGGTRPAPGSGRAPAATSGCGTQLDQVAPAGQGAQGLVLDLADSLRGDAEQHSQLLAGGGLVAVEPVAADQEGAGGLGQV